MKRLSLACGLFGAILLACGCGQSKPAVPSWFKGDGKKDGVAAAKNTPKGLQSDLRSKIVQLEKKMAALEEAIASVKRSKEDIHSRLVKRGIRSSEDLKKPENKDDDEIQRMVNALLRKKQEETKYEAIRKQYSVALWDGKEALESLDRQLKLAQAGISDKELEDLAVTIKKIDERLDAAEPGNAADLLKGDNELDKILKSGN